MRGFDTIRQALYDSALADRARRAREPGCQSKDRMQMNRLSALIVAIAAALLLAACGDKGSPAGAPPSVLAVAGDGVVTLTWNAEPDVEYMVFYAAASSITVDNWTTLPQAHAILSASSPQVVPRQVSTTTPALVNGTTYSFTVNGRKGGGPGGPGSPSVSATPRLAGATWTAGTPLGTNDLLGVGFGTVFVAVGANGAMYSSTDGTAWTALNFTVTSNLNAAVYGGNYVAVGAGGVILFSSDAITWTQRTSGTANSLNAVTTNGGSVYVAVGANGTILNSGDGQNWTVVNSGTTNNLYGVAYGNGLYLAVGANGTLLISGDATNWSVATSQTTLDLKGAAYGALVDPTTGTITNQYVALGNAGTLVTSNDGTTWTARPAIAANNLAKVTYATQFIAVGSGGGIFTSSNGTTWQAATSTGTTNNLNAVVPGLHGYIAVGASGTNLSAF